MSDTCISSQDLCNLRDKVVPALEAVLTQHSQRPIPVVPWHEVDIHQETFADPMNAYDLIVNLLNREQGLTADRLDYIRDENWKTQWNSGNHTAPWSKHLSLAPFHQTPGLRGMYFHESSLIWVRDQTLEQLQETLAHEFTHVFQYRAYPEFGRVLGDSVKNSGKYSDAHRNRLKMLSEGHASFITEEVCKKLNIIPEAAYPSETRAVTQMGIAEVLFFFTHPEILLQDCGAEKLLQLPKS